MVPMIQSVGKEVICPHSLRVIETCRTFIVATTGRGGGGEKEVPTKRPMTVLLNYNFMTINWKEW